jgi:hypothetical protein
MTRNISIVVLAVFFLYLTPLNVDAAGLKKALIVYHSDWGSAPETLKNELQSRGYTGDVTDNAAQGLNHLTNFSNNLTSGDQLVVYLAGHGSNPRWNRSDTSKETAASHFIQFNSGELYVHQIAPLFEKIAGNGVNLFVIDGSCSGGESVLYGMGKNYCIMSTTGVYSPGLTGFPVPSDAIGKDSTQGAFGMWWGTHKTASWLNGQIVLALPERIYQRLFRNDNTDINNLSLFLRPSIRMLTSLDLGGWHLRSHYCYLFRLIYPDIYGELEVSEKSKFTNSVDTYLSTMHGYSDPGQAFFNRLDTYLNNAILLNLAATGYVDNYTDVWKTLANDPTWDVNGNPGKYSLQMKGLTPDAYIGTSGFLKIAGEIDFLMTVLKTGYSEQEDLLRQIDAAAKDLYGSSNVLKTIKMVPVHKAWPPEPGEELNKFNTFERSLIKKIDFIDRKMKINRRSLLFKPGSQSVTQPLTKSLSNMSKAPTIKPPHNIGQADQVINQSIKKYKPIFKTIVSVEKVGISYGGLILDAYKKAQLEKLIGKFKAISPTLYYAEGRISFLLSILEDSIGKVQGSGNCSCEQKTL